MFTNKLLLLGTLGSLVVGCSSDNRANAAFSDESLPADAPAAAAPKRTSTVKKTTKATTTRSASKTTTTAKPVTKTSSAPPALVLKVPSASLPPVGKCRVWKAGASAGQQAQSRSCDGIVSTAPAGSMILDRASKTETKVVRVRYVDAKKAGQVVKVRVFTVPSGKYLWDEKV